MNPLDLPGPTFLGVYLTLLAAGFVLALVVRWLLRGPAEDVSQDGDSLGTYEAAYLSGGAPRVVEAALASLVQDGAVVVSPSTRTAALTGTPARKLDLFEQRVAKDLSGSRGDILWLRKQTNDLVQETGLTLLDRGLLVSRGTAVAACCASALPMLALLAFGVAKIQVGITRGRPVVFLVVLCLITMVIALILLLVRPRRSRLGDRVLADLRRKNSALQYAASTPNPALASGDVALAVGLFGVAALASGPLADLRHVLIPPNSGGGGSCGGGGCGGGGCGGGCGGCGG